MTLSMDENQNLHNEKDHNQLGRRWKKIMEENQLEEPEQCVEMCVEMLRDPTLKDLCALKSQIQRSDQDWIERFLESGGLEVSNI
jgi:hypothetical protein